MLLQQQNSNSFISKQLSDFKRVKNIDSQSILLCSCKNDSDITTDTPSSDYIEVSNPLSNPKLDGETSSETSTATVKDFGLINTVSVDSAVNGYVYWVEYLNASGHAEKLQLDPQGNSYVGQLPLMPAGVASYRFCLGNSIDGDILAKMPESGYYKFTVTSPMSNPLINGNPCSLTEIQSFTFDNPPTLKIDVNTANEVLVWLVYSHNGGAKSYLPMTLESGNTYSVTFPVLPAGTISYNFEVGSELGVPLAKFSNYDYSFTIEDSLDEDRHPDMLKWQQAYASTSALGFKSVNPLSTAASGIRWTGTDIFMDSRRLYLNSQSTSTLGSYVRLFGRVPIGTVWILAQYVGDDDTEGSLVVDFGVLGFRDYVYNESIPVSVPRERGKRVLIKIPYNSEEPKSVRIRQLPGVDSGNIIIDDIVITPPAADVTIIKDEVDYHPGYPSRWDPIDFYVTVANKFDKFPATAIVPKLVWRLNNGDWNHTPMEQIGASGKYHVQLPALDPGIFEYFYRVDFTGYSYNYQVRNKNNILNIDEFAPWLEASGADIISEAQTPAYLPDFNNSNLCDLENIPYESTEAWKEDWRNYEYLRFAVLNFQTNYENLVYTHSSHRICVNDLQASFVDFVKIMTNTKSKNLRTTETADTSYQKTVFSPIGQLYDFRFNRGLDFKTNVTLSDILERRIDGSTISDLNNDASFPGYIQYSLKENNPEYNTVTKYLAVNHRFMSQELIRELNNLKTEIYGSSTNTNSTVKQIRPSYVGMIVINDNFENENLVKDVYGATTVWRKLEGRFLLGAGAVSESNTINEFGKCVRGQFKTNNLDCGGEVEIQPEKLDLARHSHAFTIGPKSNGEVPKFGKLPRVYVSKKSVKLGTNSRHTVYYPEPIGSGITNFNIHVRDDNGDNGVLSRQTQNLALQTYGSKSGTPSGRFKAELEITDFTPNQSPAPHNNMHPYYATNIWERIR